jgi:hypothetical protein
MKYIILPFLLTSIPTFAMHYPIRPLLPRIAQSATSCVVQRYLDKNKRTKIEQIVRQVQGKLQPPPFLPKVMLDTIKAYYVIRSIYD